MPIAVGDTVGPYRIIEQLGQGGMATVFKAYHAALDRYVAIKVIHPAFKADTTFLARFQREARVVARLDYPGIVPVYDFAEQDGAPYLVMKFIAGETLKARLDRAPLSTAEALRVIEAVGAALSYAHGQGVLHRDVKPSNIMLGADGTVYLTDFGLARMVQASESTLSTDSLLGTPTYMSPEQARGDKELDAGTDIYSFGVVIYELLVGRVPFSADTPYAVIHDHIYTPLPPPRSLNPQLPEAVEAVLTRALEKDRVNRYASVAALVADLKRALAPQPAAAGLAPISPAAAPASSEPVPPAAPVAAPTVVAASAPAVLPATAEPPTRVGHYDPVVAPVAASAVAAGPAPAADAPRGSPYRLQWWQLALGLVIIIGGCLLVYGVLLRARQPGAAANAAATETAAAAAHTTAVVVPTTRAGATASSTAPPTASPVPIPSAAEQHLKTAQDDFAAGQTGAALTQLDQAVAVNPNDTTVWLRAADLALQEKQAVPALQRYYVPAITLESHAPDANLGTLQGHAALGFYVAAADQQAGTYLDSAASQYPESVVPLIARQRYQVFFASGQGVPAQLNGIAKTPAQTAMAGLVLGDYYLARTQFLEATRQYTPVSLMHLANGSVPDWMIREARCDLEVIRAERANAKLEATCVDLSSLLTGK